MTDKFQNLMMKLSGRQVIEDEYRTDGNYLIHISDTPSSIFRYLAYVIHKVKPKYIIHTGDLVDDIKLEIRPYKIDLYERKLIRLLNMLEASTAEYIYITVGNHDDIDLIKKHSTRITIVEKETSLYIGNKSFSIAHKFDDLDRSKADTDYYLYGHDLTKSSVEENDTFFLNGLDYIFVLDLDEQNLSFIRYPSGTNEDRLCQHKIGI